MRKTIHRDEYDRVRALLREARVQSGFRQSDLAAALGRLQSFVSDVERGTRRIDVIELRDWCRALDTDLVDFCEALERQLPPPVTAGRRKATRKRSPSQHSKRKR